MSPVLDLSSARAAEVQQRIFRMSGDNHRIIVSPQSFYAGVRCPTWIRITKQAVAHLHHQMVSSILAKTLDRFNTAVNPRQLAEYTNYERRLEQLSFDPIFSPLAFPSHQQFYLDPPEAKLLNTYGHVAS